MKSVASIFALTLFVILLSISTAISGDVDKDTKQQIHKLWLQEKRQEKLRTEYQRMIEKARIQHNQINKWNRQQKKSVLNKKRVGKSNKLKVKWVDSRSIE